jgi:hypothetical protein
MSLELLTGDHHRCGTRCLYAKGSQCNCDCEGENHGKEHSFMIDSQRKPVKLPGQKELFGKEISNGEGA